MDKLLEALMTDSITSLMANMFGVLKIVVPASLLLAVTFFGVRWVIRKARGG